MPETPILAKEINGAINSAPDQSMKLHLQLLVELTVETIWIKLWALLQFCPVETGPTCTDFKGPERTPIPFHSPLANVIIRIMASLLVSAPLPPPRTVSSPLIYSLAPLLRRNPHHVPSLFVPFDSVSYKRRSASRTLVVSFALAESDSPKSLGDEPLRPLLQELAVRSPISPRPSLL